MSNRVAKLCLVPKALNSFSKQSRASIPGKKKSPLSQCRALGNYGILQMVYIGMVLAVAVSGKM